MKLTQRALKQDFISTMRKIYGVEESEEAQVNRFDYAKFIAHRVVIQPSRGGPQMKGGCTLYASTMGKTRARTWVGKILLVRFSMVERGGH